MKVLLCLLAVMAISVQTDASLPSIEELIRRNGQRAADCMKELKLDNKSVQVPYNALCVNVCEQEKMGLMVNGKYVIHKYLKGYTRRFPDASEERVDTMIHCLREANKISDKCEIGKTLQECIMKNFRFLFIGNKEKQ